MSWLPPPPPIPNSQSRTISSPFGGEANASVSKLNLRNSSSSNHDNFSIGKASPTPLLVSISLCIGSCVLLFIGGSNSLFYAVIGYVFTPIAATVCIAWDNIWQRHRARNSSWFVKNWSYVTALKIVASISFLIAIPHIWHLSNIIATKVANGN